MSYASVIRKFRLTIGLALYGFSLGASATENASLEWFQNQLKGHPAPYLALHGDDPVSWQNWGEPVLEMARQQDKILYLSIGYFACHWCHVMQKESYQNVEIAEYLNRHFIPVKVDRELEPALDRRLMDFTQAILGRGGWPLNVFITPSGHPIFSVLYSPPQQFLTTLHKLQTVWTHDRSRIEELVSNEGVRTFPRAAPELDRDHYLGLLATSADGVMVRADPEGGGFGNSQKFPSTPQLDYLLDSYQATRDPGVRAFLEYTLDAMYWQGMHDHLAGGFFRYTVDAQWAIPHFEKMLYDNANLASLYIKAAGVLDRPDYEVAARRTLDFMNENMWHPDGAFVSSFSAVDDDNIEGGSYLWKWEEVEALLDPEQRELADAIWRLSREPELPAGNHLRYYMTLEEYARNSGNSSAKVESVFVETRNRMLDARNHRSLPVDDKLLAGWNGLALSAFVTASRSFGDPTYENTAMNLRNFLVGELWDGERLSRSMARGGLIGSASLEDYAYVGRGLIDWAMYSGSEPDLELARDITHQGWDRFYRGNAWYQGDGTLLAPAGGDEILSDAANAAPSAVLIQNSLVLGERLSDDVLSRQAMSALNRGETLLTRLPFWHVSQFQALAVALAMNQGREGDAASVGD